MGERAERRRQRKVLADPARLRLLSLIRSADGGRATTGVLADRLGLTQPTATRHLGALLDAGFLERERDGRQTWYWVNTEGLQAIRQLLDPARAGRAAASDTAYDDLSDGVDRLAASLETRPVVRPES